MTKTDAAVQTLSEINPDVVLEVRTIPSISLLCGSLFPSPENQLFHPIQYILSFGRTVEDTKSKPCNFHPEM